VEVGCLGSFVVPDNLGAGGKSGICDNVEFMPYTDMKEGICVSYILGPVAAGIIRQEKIILCLRCTPHKDLE
jgi:hypothetical protein